MGFLNRLAASQVRILEEEWNNRPTNSHFKSPEKVLILASFIEEKILISSVFAIRLDKRMLLQTDSTLIYCLTEGKVILDGELASVN